MALAEETLAMIAEVLQSDHPDKQKIADDLRALDMAMEALTGDHILGTPATEKWHNTGIMLVASNMTEQMLRGLPYAMQQGMGPDQIISNALELVFCMGYLLGEGEYNIQKCTCQNKNKEPQG